MKIDNILLFLLIFYGILALIIGVGVYITYAYLNLIPDLSQTLSTINIALITASSVLFGFSTLSLVRFLDRISMLKQSASDLAKELCELHKKVIDSEELSSKEIFYESTTEVFGGADIERYYGKAPKAIEHAYNSVAYLFRWRLKYLYGNFTTWYQLIPVITLIGSMIASLFAFAPSLTGTLLFWAIALFLFSLPAILIGWYYSNKWLNGFDDSFFNIRQQILGQLEGILPSGYSSSEFNVWQSQSEYRKSQHIIDD